MNAGRPDHVSRNVREALADVAVETGQELLRAWKRRAATDPYLTLGVFPDDPPGLAEAVYRAKAKFFHPDNKETGDAARFKALGEALAKIKDGTARVTSFGDLGNRVQEAIRRHQEDDDA